MLTKEATSEQVKEWKAIFEEYKPRLFPNRKTAWELIEYLKDKYPVLEVSNDLWRKVVIDNVMATEHYAEKLLSGIEPKAEIFLIVDKDQARRFYQDQDDVFAGMEIIVGIELETAYFHVEGSSLLWDELFAFRGLDASDLNNAYLVAEYISCLKRFGMLEEVLKIK